MLSDDIRKLSTHKHTSFSLRQLNQGPSGNWKTNFSLKCFCLCKRKYHLFAFPLNISMRSIRGMRTNNIHSIHIPQTSQHTIFNFTHSFILNSLGCCLCVYFFFFFFLLYFSSLAGWLLILFLLYTPFDMHSKNDGAAKAWINCIQMPDNNFHFSDLLESVLEAHAMNAKVNGKLLQTKKNES